MPFSQAIDNQILDHFFGKSTWAATGDARHVGLSSTTPTKTGTNVTEPSTGSYARVQLTAAEMDAAASSTTSNNADQTFPAATADWVGGSNLTNMVMYDAGSGGNFLAYKSLVVAKPVLNGDTAKFATGDMDFTIAGTA